MIRALFLALMLALPAGTALAQTSSGNTTMQVYITRTGDGPVSEVLDLPLSKAAIIHLPVDAADVLVTNPEVADAVIRTPTRAYLLGQAIGQTNAFFFDAEGNLILDLDIRVERDMRALQEALDRFLPDRRVSAEAMNDHIVLSGSVRSAAEADTALRLAQRWTDDPDNVLSMLAIEGREQVMLSVRIVEMQRTIVRQLGINLSAAGQIDDVAFNVATEQEFSLVGRALSGLNTSLNYTAQGGGDISTAGALIQALERVGLVRTLAEPNLTAISGEAANFLAGGEFPVPVGRDRDGNIIVEYKQFGVGLGFTPIVLSEGRISLRISTEISELTNQGSLQLGSQDVTDDQGNVIGTVPGLQIPGLNVNRAETTVELPSGGSLVLAGLIQEETRQNLDGIPGVQNLPVLGALFRSRDFENQETELVVLVTPYLVDPINQNEAATPADGFQPASELETLFLGNINRAYAVPGARTDGRSWNGPVGFLLD
ncbi:type II and III secretion system protein family protein [Hyphobacterium sp. HN65]|uniref:Type II and III secretion system protein family protein n=1 Tax=Hyphobacterium lacteum TaxID=3116575 RepID=A0ABU7LNM8_9PROT|nr:type II and III secretion system protein family protein [Hyphobacterium sp. HN65]MEE2525512.1 type II and III secretion system protein family protein [Hyphobacterium sp. HN65]